MIAHSINPKLLQYLILPLKNKNVCLAGEYCWWVNKYFRCWAKTPSGSIWEQTSTFFFFKIFWHFFGKNRSDNRIEHTIARLLLGEGRSGLVSVLLLLLWICWHPWNLMGLFWVWGLQLRLKSSSSSQCSPTGSLWARTGPRDVSSKLCFYAENNRLGNKQFCNN